MNDARDASHRCGDEDTSFEQLSTQQMLAVNLWCDRYEKLWAKSERPTLAEFVQSVELEDVHAFRALALELITMDVHYKRLAGDSIRLNDFVDQFPTVDEQAIRDILLPKTTTTGSSQTASGLAEENELRKGQQIGDYVIEERIGRGGMGSVYRAHHQLMGRIVAIKALTLRTSQDPSSLLRFEREIKSVAKMSHPNVVTAYDARLQDGSLYLVTEWIQGRDLGEIVLEQGPLPVEEALDVAIQAAKGLDYAHSIGYIHRDVKPSNLVRDGNGNVKLLDLGLAKLLEQRDANTGSTPLTADHQVVGTAEYLSPEQARTPNVVDVRTDIYSLGCTMMFLLTGKPPFVGESPIDTLLEHINAQPPMLCSEMAGQALPDGLSALVHSMLSKSVDDRPASMQTVLKRLVQIRSLTSSDFAAPQAGWNLRDGWLPWVAVAAMILAAIGFAIGRGNFGSRSSDINESSSSSNLSDGLLFNGRTSYAEVQDFDVELDGPAMIEVIATPQTGPLPCNLVTWGGDDLFVLFAGFDQKWGVASLNDGESHLEVSRDSYEIGRKYLLAAKRKGDQLELWVDGSQVPTRRGEYELVSSRRSLCFGGLPDGLLPRHQGTRFFAGIIHQVRISKGEELQPAARVHNILAVESSTVGMFDLSEGEGAEAKSTVNGFRVQLIDTQWEREFQTQKQP
ncbi:protein kinase domain-containing protein [Neorhodopirellula pilleata]|uniref:Serine/threonine-protein kinase PknB n=1 Tax=Neorhodopirellula pilleata TaxID=2714738 RepID=A0A5C6AS06_9BACT|nr:protein kinase [Neorhodopirellula pilleata]TWU02039.1 Serine/threonine-protein kinase PknB [Neorhodopirellula pilleata]